MGIVIRLHFQQLNFYLIKFFFFSYLFHRPPIIQKVKAELTEIFEANGLENVEEACGTQAQTWAN